MIIKNAGFKFSLVLIFQLCFLSEAFASLEKAQESRTQRHILENGMVLLVTPMPESPTASIYALFKTGSATEGQYLGMGISHFVEHMLFKGTKKRAVGVIPAEVKALGGSINASTSYDHTIYTLDVPSASFTQGLDIIADMVSSSVFDPAEVEKERQVIFSEMKMINDRPERKLSDLIARCVYLQHPYRHPIIGYTPLFGQITQEQLVEYYKRHYIPNSMVLSIAGNVDAEEVLESVTEKFKDFKQGPFQDRNLPSEPLQISSRAMVSDYPSEMTRLAMVYQGVNLLHPDLYALDVLAMILGQGESSRLYQDILKKRNLVTSVSAFNFTPIDKGAFEVILEFEKGNVDVIAAVVGKNIEDVKKRGVKPVELEKARRQVLSSLIFGKQVSSSVAYNTAVNEAMAGDHDFDSKYLEGVRKVTLEDIRRVAQAYLVEYRLSVVVLKPKTAHDPGPGLKKAAEESAIFKEQFSNGLTVLLKEDQTLPIASVFLALRAGTREESLEQNGLAQLTADLWSQSGGPWKSQKLSEMVEARGASLHSSGGYGTMSLNMNFLSEDLPFALDVIEELVVNPKFAPEDYEHQKKLNLATIKEQNDSIFQTGINNLRKMLFKSHPLRMDTSGTIEGLGNVNRQHVLDYYRKFLTPDHMVVGVYGNIKKGLVLADLKKRFARLPKHAVALSTFKEELIEKPREQDLMMHKEQAAVIIGFHAPDIYDADRYGMEVISSIFGSSLSGRMFKRIREELGDAYTLGSIYSPSLDAGMILFYVLTKEAQLERVKEILWGEIQAALDVPVENDELKATQVKLKSDFAKDRETLKGLVTITALDELYGLGYEHYTDYDSKIDSVTVRDIQRIARKYLDRKSSAMLVILPGKTDGN